MILSRVIPLLLSLLVLLACKKKENPDLTTPAPYNNNVVQWKAFNSNTGLSGNEIKAITQDNSGNVWVATESEYNEPMGTGNGWWIRQTTSLQRVLKTGVVTAVMDSNISEHFNGRISALHFGELDEINMGMLYEGLFPALTRRKNNQFERLDITNATSAKFFSFSKNSDGLWFGLPYYGLYVSNSSSFTKFDHTNTSLPQNCTHFDLLASNSNLYINTFESIMVKANGAINVVYDNTFSIGLAEDSEGDRWTVGLNSNQSGYDLIKMTDTDSTHIHTPIYYSPGIISALAIDSHDNIWIATHGGGAQGLFKFNGTTWVNYTTANSPLHSQNLTKLFVDTEGNLWIGSSDAGLIVLNEFGTQN